MNEWTEWEPRVERTTRSTGTLVFPSLKDSGWGTGPGFSLFSEPRSPSLGSKWEVSETLTPVYRIGETWRERRSRLTPTLVNGPSQLESYGPRVGPRPCLIQGTRKQHRGVVSVFNDERTEGVRVLGSGEGSGRVELLDPEGRGVLKDLEALLTRPPVETTEGQGTQDVPLCPSHPCPI